MYAIEASEGKQGKHTYFTASMRWGELQHLAVFHEQLPELDEDHRMQRGLAKKRLGDLEEYLQEPDHFFSALTLIILPRDLKRPAKADAPGSAEWDYSFERAEKNGPGVQRRGRLHLSGDVQLFPGDGQHRLKAGLQAIRSNPGLAREEVPVVLIPYENADQVRQLFSDLNLNAKPVSKTIGYDFETRDPFVVVAKDVGRKVPLFLDRVNRISNSLPKSSLNVISLNTLVQATRSIAGAIASQADVEVDDYIKGRDAVAEVAGVFEVIVGAFPEWDRVTNKEQNPDTGNPWTPGDLRDEFLFPHGLGWQACANAAAELIEKHGDAWSSRLKKAVRSLDWSRKAPVWKGNAVIHDENNDTNRVNNTAPAVKQIAAIIVSNA
jgi:DGQHR domain-containing protein